MNHPEGNCPLCLCPLAIEDKEGSSLPFMKLLSCYHCFHRWFLSYFFVLHPCLDIFWSMPCLYSFSCSECIIRWWKWLLEQNDTTVVQETTAAAAESQRGISSLMCSFIIIKNMERTKEETCYEDICWVFTFALLSLGSSSLHIYFFRVMCFSFPPHPAFFLKHCSLSAKLVLPIFVFISFMNSYMDS